MAAIGNPQLIELAETMREKARVLEQLGGSRA
jgi:hypothetical protein